MLIDLNTNMRWREIIEATKHNPDVFRDVEISHEEGETWHMPKPYQKAAYKTDKRRRKNWRDGYDDKHMHGGDADNSSVNRHVTNDTGHLNSYLLAKHRGDNVSAIALSREEIIDKISQAISTTTPLEHEYHVYHGTRINPKTLEDNGVIHFPTLISTSTHPLVAKSFASVQNGERNILHFILPKGFVRGMRVYSTQPGRVSEAEYLIDKGTNWRIVDHKTVRESSKSLGGRGKDAYFATKPYKGIVNIWSLVPA